MVSRTVNFNADIADIVGIAGKLECTRGRTCTVHVYNMYTIAICTRVRVRTLVL